MPSKIEINPAYPRFKNVLLNIKALFDSKGETIHKARNELKIIEIEGLKCVVKAFRVPNLVNRFAYAYIRRSKAYKSFHNGLRLVQLGVNTPEPIGYIEFYIVSDQCTPSSRKIGLQFQQLSNGLFSIRIPAQLAVCRGL